MRYALIPALLLIGCYPDNKETVRQYRVCKAAGMNASQDPLSGEVHCVVPPER